MCVIFACDENFPSYENLKDAEMMNGDGGGIAWLDSKKQVHFKKGLTAKEIQGMIDSKSIKLPCVIHFRIASVGSVTKELCHPFIISNESPVKLSGVLPKKSDGVLFHNGTVSDYEEILKEAVMTSCTRMLKGDYSDSRVMAFISSLYGHEFLKFVKGWNKFCVLDKDGLHKYGTWSNIEKGVTASNEYFKPSWMGSMYADPYGEYGINFDPLNDPDTLDYSEKWQKVESKDGLTSYYKPSYNPKEMDELVDNSRIIEDDDDALKALFDEHTKKEIERNITKSFETFDNINEKPYYSKQAIKPIDNTKDAKIDFLRKNKWKDPERLSDSQLDKAVVYECDNLKRIRDNEQEKNDLKYLMDLGWKSPQKLNRMQLRRAVENEQKIQALKTKMRKSIKNKSSENKKNDEEIKPISLMTAEDYETMYSKNEEWINRMNSSTTDY